MKKAKFTIIDAGIILVAAVLMVVGISVLGGKIGAPGEKKEVYFTVLASRVDEGISSTVKENQEVGISFSEEAYATVVGVSEEPHKEHRFFDTKGYYLEHTIEEKSDIKVVLKCEAEVTDTKISNNNVPIRVGESMAVCGKGYTLTGYVIEVEEK